VTEFHRVNGVWNCHVAPIQTRQESSVPLVVAEEAYKEYAARFGSNQSLKRLNERGGFGASELAILLYHRIKRLEESCQVEAGK
jgi:hypothetical protein